MIDVSDTVNDFVNLLGRYAQEGLNERENLARLLQHANDTKKTEIIGNMAFRGKYLWRLYATVKRELPDSEHYEKLGQEFSQTVQEFQAILADLITDGDEEFVHLVESHFLTVSESALKNVLSLAQDFYYLKNWELEFVEREGGAAE
jgi:hypothetical protein